MSNEKIDEDLNYGDQKYWEVDVCHNHEQKRMRSYLRLGTSETLLDEEQPKDGDATWSYKGTSGDELWGGAAGGCLPSKFPDDFESEWTAPGGPPKTPFNRGRDLAKLVVDFYDDDRYTGPNGSQTNQLSGDQRKRESERLHIKGGWRSHSDGNRINTTRGDVVEVVRGNFSRVVLGRQDSLGQQTRDPSSGGHMARTNDSMTPGGIQSIRWEQNKYDGTWKCIEECMRGDYISRYHGDMQELFYGNLKKSITGSEEASSSSSGGPAIPQDGLYAGKTKPPDLSGGAPPEPALDGSWVSCSGAEKKLNPEIFEQTWARLIDTKTGSAPNPVPLITDTTWAKAIESETHAETITETTHADSMSDTTNSTTISSITNAEIISSVTTSTLTSDITMAKGVLQSVTLAPLQESVTVTACDIDLGLHGIAISAKVAGLILESEIAALTVKHEAAVTVEFENTIKLSKAITRIKTAAMHILN